MITSAVPSCPVFVFEVNVFFFGNPWIKMKLYLKKGTHLQLEKTYQVLTSSKNTRNHRPEGNISWFLTVQSSKQELSKVLVRFQPKNKPGGSLTLSDITFFSGKQRGRQKNDEWELTWEDNGRCCKSTCYLVGRSPIKIKLHVDDIGEAPRLGLTKIMWMPLHTERLQPKWEFCLETI